MLFIVTIFYAVPAFQFIDFYYQQRTESFDLFPSNQTQIYCYYNFQCLKPYWGVQAFNNGKILPIFFLVQSILKMI